MTEAVDGPHAADGHKAIGRYGAPRLIRWGYAAVALLWIVLAAVSVVRGRDRFQVVLAVVWTVLAVGNWFIPPFVISADGVPARLAPDLRALALRGGAER